MAFEPRTSIAQIMSNASQNYKSPLSQLSAGYARGVGIKTAKDQNRRANEELDLAKKKMTQEEAERVAEEIGGYVSGIAVLPPEQRPAAWDNFRRTSSTKYGKDPGPYSEQNLQEILHESKIGVQTSLKAQQYGEPETFIGPDGKPVGVQYNPYGHQRVAPGGYRPEPSKPLVKLDLGMGGVQETEERKSFGKTLVKGYETIRDDSRAAETAMQQYQMAKNIDLETSGPIEAWKSSAVALAANLGFDPSMLAQANNVKAYEGIMQNMVLTKMQAQKGPQTENDSKRIERTLGTIGNPEEARKFLLDAGMAMESEKIDKHEFWMKWRDTHNGTFDGAESAWSKFKAKTPFLAKNPNTGRPVFFSQFVREMKNANQGISYGEIVDFWQKKYAN